MFSVKEEVTQVAIACRRLASLMVIFPSKVVVLPSLDTDSASSPLSTLLSSAATFSSPSSTFRHTNSTPSPLTRRSGVPSHGRFLDQGRHTLGSVVGLALMCLNHHEEVHKHACNDVDREGTVQSNHPELM